MTDTNSSRNCRFRYGDGFKEMNVRRLPAVFFESNLPERSEKQSVDFSNECLYNLN